MFLCVDFYASTSTKCTKSQYKVTDATLLYGATKFQSLVPSGNLPAFLLTLIIPSRYIATSGSLLISTISWFFACITFDATPVSLSISPQIRFNMSEASLVRSRGPAGWHPQCHLRAKLCNYGKSPNISLLNFSENPSGKMMFHEHVLGFCRSSSKSVQIQLLLICSMVIFLWSRRAGGCVVGFPITSCYHLLRHFL